MRITEFYREEYNLLIYGGMPEAKAVIWVSTDVEKRKRGEQTGLDTLVVCAVKDEC